jgi:hypothetical protein
MYIYIYGFMCFEGLRLMGRLFGSRTCSRSLKALIFWDFCLSPQMEKKFHGFIILNSYICDLGPGFIPVNQLFLSHSMSMSSDNQGCGKPSLSLSLLHKHTQFMNWILHGIILNHLSKMLTNTIRRCHFEFAGRCCIFFCVDHGLWFFFSLKKLAEEIWCNDFFFQTKGVDWILV